MKLFKTKVISSLLFSGIIGCSLIGTNHNSNNLKIHEETDFFQDENIPNSTRVSTSFTQDNETYLVGCESNGLYSLIKEYWSKLNFPTGNGYFINTINQSSNGNILVGTTGHGILISKNKGLSFEEVNITPIFNGSVNQIFILNDKTLVSTSEGVYSYDGSIFTEINMGLPNKVDSNLAFIGDNQDIWVGTKNGLYRSIGGTSNFGLVTLKDGVNFDITTISQIGNIIYIGTSANGIYEINVTTGDVVSSYLLNDYIYSSFTTDSYVYFGTMFDGLYRQDIAPGSSIEQIGGIKFSNDNTVTSINDVNDYLYITTIGNGIWTNNPSVPQPVPPTPTPTPTPDNGKNDITIYIIIGTAIVGGAALIAGITYYVRKAKKRNQI